MVSAVVSAVSLEGRIVATAVTAVTAVIAVARWTRVGDVVVKARLRELPPPAWTRTGCPCYGRRGVCDGGGGGGRGGGLCGVESCPIGTDPSINGY